jgi:hypothetical protein
MSQNKIHKLEPQIYYYTFGPNEPALTVSNGDTVVASTRDARGYDTIMQPIPEELNGNFGHILKLRAGKALSRKSEKCSFLKPL